MASGYSIQLPDASYRMYASTVGRLTLCLSLKPWLGFLPDAAPVPDPPLLQLASTYTQLDNYYTPSSPCSALRRNSSLSSRSPYLATRVQCLQKPQSFTFRHRDRLRSIIACSYEVSKPNLEKILTMFFKRQVIEESMFIYFISA